MFLTCYLHHGPKFETNKQQRKIQWKMSEVDDVKTISRQQFLGIDKHINLMNSQILLFINTCSSLECCYLH